LPDSKKQYDRDTALQAIKLIMARGYQIIPPAQEVDAPTAVTETAQEVRNLNVAQTVGVWHASDRDDFRAGPDFYRELAEPITPRGEVYASEVFAAIAFAERVDAFTCDYVGQIGLAKEYGTYPTYHVRRR
jgi:hypothetical protein